MKYYHMLLVLKIIAIPPILLGMEPRGAQLELCPTRKVYNQSQKAQPCSTKYSRV